MRGLRDKVILVCGGAGGIGAATVRRLAEEGARVAIGDRDMERARETASISRDARAFEYDQADDASIAGLIERVVERYGHLDGVFANVADLDLILEDKDILANDPPVWERTLRVNVTGTAMVVRACIPRFLERGAGVVAITSSSASAMGEPERPSYAASKAGVESMCRHIASKWGKRNIRANAIAPGLIVTAQLEAGMGREWLEKMLPGVRAPRHGRPEDIAAVAAFLLSDDAEFVNGQVWHVNGGVCFGG